jgi:NAD(P)-dependent dehydrogenase (short-subunit alcohol dehydrogenase family)
MSMGGIMTAATTVTNATGAPNRLELDGQKVVVIGGSSGIGLETARQARLEGAEVTLTGRDHGRLQDAARRVDAVSTAAFDATDPDRLARFFADLPGPIDHLMITAGGSYYASLADLDFTQVQRALGQHLLLPLQVAQLAVGAVRPEGSLIYMTGSGARRPGVGLSVAGILAAALPALTANMALEMAPVRVNLIAAGFVDTPLSASLLGRDLQKRRDELAAALPIRRVVGPADVAALAVHLMTNTALTGATYDIDGGEQVISNPAS